MAKGRYKIGTKTVGTCKIKHLQNIFKNVLVFYFTRNHLEKCFQMFHAKTFAVALHRGNAVSFRSTFTAK